MMRPPVLPAVLWSMCQLLSCVDSMCPAGCVCDDDNLTVECADTALQFIPIVLNPSVERLMFRKSELTTLEEQLNFYPELVYLDVSHNRLHDLGPRTFEMQQKLTQLNLDDNKISSVNNKTFQRLRSLQVLNLGGNLIDRLGQRCFAPLRSLEHLDLSRNRIASIHRDAFSDLPNLRVLDLRNNYLKQVPSHAFHSLGRLAELRLGYNTIQSLIDGQFSYLQELSVLDLQGCGLTTLSHLSFRGVESLRSLNLADNSLLQVPTNQLAVVGRLKSLYLGQNLFESIPEGAFRPLRYLELIDLTGCPRLKLVSSDAFVSNLDLRTLWFNSTRSLTSIQPETFRGLSNLQHLSFHQSALTTVPENGASWGDLATLDLSSNPLECRCDIIWLRKVAHAQNNSLVICDSPPALHNRILKDLSDDQLSCYFGQTKDDILIVVGIVLPVAVLLAVLICVWIRCRKRLQLAFKEYRWRSGSSTAMQQEYKASIREDYISVYSQKPLKPFPVTEL